MSRERDAETGGTGPGGRRAIRALAHPARVAVLERLVAGDVLTATECAEVAGLTPSAMSYHLRALERYGLVARAEPSGDGRERPWRALGTPAAVVVREVVLSPAEAHDLAARVDALLAPYADRSDAPPDAVRYDVSWAAARAGEG